MILRELYAEAELLAAKAEVCPLKPDPARRLITLIRKIGQLEREQGRLEGKAGIERTSMAYEIAGNRHSGEIV